MSIDEERMELSYSSSDSELSQTSTMRFQAHGMAIFAAASRATLCYVYVYWYGRLRKSGLPGNNYQIIFYCASGAIKLDNNRSYRMYFGSSQISRGTDQNDRSSQIQYPEIMSTSKSLGTSYNDAMVGLTDLAMMVSKRSSNTGCWKFSA